ncbi:MAG TPA: ATP-binding protein [Solirubrobacteraceae bacterium]|jgi:signal transduction histidine kinase|nr:ATP-binding protein [Solirubrobacteraceae bacterium]
MKTSTPSPGARLRSGWWLRKPRRTARLRFTAVYGALFLVSGAALVATTYVLFERATEYRQPQLPRVPQTPTIKGLKHGLTGLPAALSYDLPKLAKAQHLLAQAQHQLARNLQPNKLNQLTFSVPRLVRDQQELTRDQRQLSQVQQQLARAVHQIAQAGSIEAAQRASDSHELLVDSGIALAIVAVLALLAGWIVAGRMLRPIRTITRTARRISSASLHERLALDGPPDELKELGDTLDDLLDRLEASFEAQRQFAANASHELRTPLARQRALIQVALADPHASFSSLRAAHERVLASEQNLEQMIEALLTLARGEAGPERREDLDLETLASHAVLARQSELAARGLEIHAALASAPTVGDPRLIERLIANLIDNAIHHNSAGGLIEIATRTSDGRALVSISNSGALVPPEEVERLFEPFQRLGNARTRHDNGYGLGLSIVHAIADTHGAKLSATALPQGGLSVEVSFPPPGAAGSTPPSRNSFAARDAASRSVPI